MELQEITLDVNKIVKYNKGDKTDVFEDDHAREPIKKYTLYRERWVVLVLFGLNSAVNAMQWGQCTIIRDVVVKYYGVSSNTVYWTGMSYMVVYIPLVFPVSWLMDKVGLRIITIVAASTTTLGLWLKVFSVPQNMFWLGSVGQASAAVGQVFILSVPPRLAAIWFGAKQVSSACSLGVFWNQLGVAIGFVLPPLMVHKDSSIEQLAKEFQLMFYIVAGISTVLLVAIVLFFKAAPATPPSAAAALGLKQESNYLQSIKNLLTNKNYILMLFTYGMNGGILGAIATSLNAVILAHYPGANEHVGKIGLVLAMSGVVGSVLSGIVLDKTLKFKETTLALYAAATIGMVIFTFTIDCGYIAVVYLVVIFNGLFFCGYVPVGFELGSEITYPVTEGTTSGLLNVATQVFGISFTLLYEHIMDSVGDRWANLTFCAVLALGTALTAAIKPDLRRQAAQHT